VEVDKLQKDAAVMDVAIPSDSNNKEEHKKFRKYKGVKE